MIFRILLLIINFLFSQNSYVSYGWEIFEYSQSARTAALGNAVSAYENNSSSSMENPVFISKKKNRISLTHQNRFAGLLSSDLLTFDLQRNNQILNVNLIYENISDIPDTRNVLLDWGIDGQFGTNDLGEGNGIIDEGERLDTDKISFFNQRRIGFYSAINKKIKNYPIGFGIKVISTALKNNFSIGVGFDIGIIKNIKTTKYAFILENFPSSGILWENGTIEGTSPSLIFGLDRPFHNKNIKNIKFNLLYSFKTSFSNRHLDSQFRIGNFSLDNSFGLEISYKKNLAFRFGKNKVNNLTGGLGVSFNEIEIHYAFLNSALDYGLGSHHIISLNCSYDWITKQLLKI